MLETDENDEYGTIPVYNGETPTRLNKGDNYYTFKGWDKEITSVTGDVTYTAQYDVTIGPPANPDDFSYKTYDNTVQVKLYFGNDTVIAFPSEINGMPVTTIAKSSFDQGNSMDTVKTIYIPDSVTVIGGNAFSKYSALERVIIPDSVTKIDANAFAECPKLETIDIPEGVTTVGSSAFSHCTGLKSVTIPESMTKIGYQAFFDCTSVKEIVYNGTKEQWDKIVFEDGNDKLKDVTVTFKNGETGKIDLTKDTTDTDTSSDTDTDTDTESDTVEYKPMTRGDVDGDNKITAKDSLSIQRYVLHFKKFDANQLRAADADGDGKVTNKDAMNILRYSINIKIKFTLGDIV